MKSFARSVIRVWVFCVLFFDDQVRIVAGDEWTAGPSEIKNANNTNFVAGTAVKQTKGRVVLTIGARNLRDVDITSRSDPFCQVESQDLKTSAWKSVGRTETLQDNLNPTFERTIDVEYNFEVSQPLRFLMYDQDPDKLDFLGFAKTKLETLVRAGYTEINLNLNKNDIDLTERDLATKKQEAMKKKTSSLRGNKTIKMLAGEPKPPSQILIWAEEYDDGQQSAGENLVTMNIKGVKLSAGGKRILWFGLNKPNPYVDISKEMIAGGKTYYRLVHRTETLKGTTNPEWAQLLTMYSSLAEEDPKRKLKFECKDSQRRSNHGYIGEFITTIEEIQNSKNGQFALIDEKRKAKSSKYVNSGTLKIQNFDIIKTASFLKYVMGNLDIQAIIAIDFTASNGNQRQMGSLHYVGSLDKADLYGREMNQYEQAITSIVSIIQEYDSDKQFPVYGYGAAYFAENHVRHIFPVNFNEQNPECKEVEGVLAAYHNCLRRITFSGPTNFAPVIKDATKIARAYEKGKSYAILLIITDGQITDMEDTKNAIIDGSNLPLSIIIVGVGKGNFDKMDELDADGGLLESFTKTAKRDIVQFVPFSKYYKPGDEVAKKLLAREVLAEVPKQLITYMATHKLMPTQKLRPTPPKPSNASQNTPDHQPQNPKLKEKSLQSVDEKPSTDQNFTPT